VSFVQYRIRKLKVNPARVQGLELTNLRSTTSSATGDGSTQEANLLRTVALEKLKIPKGLPSRRAAPPATPNAEPTTAKWLVIASGKGGTSKTTTTLNLATVAAAAGLSVAVLDTDEQATLSKWHARREIFRERHPDEAVPPIRLFSLPLGELDAAMRKVDATPDVDLVIVDTPPGLEQRLLISKLIRRADFLLVPTSQGTADLESANEFMVAAIGVGGRAAFLLSRTNQRWGSYRIAKKVRSSRRRWRDMGSVRGRPAG
jgi:hypothetical protein